MLRAEQQMPSQPEAATVVSSLRPALAGIALISGVVNVLALTAPLFMLQVYDRVLSSHSLPTLVGLAVLATGLYAFQSLLDIIRSRVLLRIGERFDHQLSGRVHEAVVRLPLLTRMPGDGLQPLRDLDNVRGFLSGQGPTAFFDLPWMPLYLGICFIFHFWIGVTALVGAIVLISLTLLTDLLSRRPTRETIRHGMARNALMEAGRRNAEVVSAMGLGGAYRGALAPGECGLSRRQPPRWRRCGRPRRRFQVAPHDAAVDHPRCRRLAGHRAGNDRWRDDRQLHHDEPGACPC